MTRTREPPRARLHPSGSARWGHRRKWRSGRQADDELAALARPVARRGQAAAVHLGQRPGQRQPDPQPALRPGQRAVALCEQLEHPRELLGRDAHAGVPDLDDDLVSPSCSADSQICPPLSVYLAALVSRFVRICSSRTGSASAGKVPVATETVSLCWRASISGRADSMALWMTMPTSSRSLRSRILPRVIRETSNRSSISRDRCLTWRLITSMDQAIWSAASVRVANCDGAADRRQRVAQLVCQHGQELVLAAVGLGQLLQPAPQLVLQALPIGDVAEDEDHAGGRAALFLDGGAAVVDRSLDPILGDQNRMVGQADDDVVAKHAIDRVLDRLVGVLGDDPERHPSGISRPPRLIAIPSSLGRPGSRRSTRPCASVAMTASPMLLSTAVSHCWLVSTRRREACRASTSRVISTPPPTKSTIETTRHGAMSGSKTRPIMATRGDQEVASRPGPNAAVPGANEHGQVQHAAESLADVRDRKKSDRRGDGQHRDAVAQRPLRHFRHHRASETIAEMDGY